MGVIPTPRSRTEADELRLAVTALPSGALAQLYVDLYNLGFRIAFAPDEAKRWYKELAT